MQIERGTLDQAKLWKQGGKDMREKIMETWKKENLICKIAYILTCVLFFWIPFEGLVLESLNLHLLGYEGVRILYIFTIICAIAARKWKLVLLVVVGTFLVWVATLGLSEVLWYYLKTWFGIDISYR